MVVLHANNERNRSFDRPVVSFFQQLPRDILLQMLEFCNGKSMSTLLLATSGCPDLDVENMIGDRVTLRLVDMARRIEKHQSSQPILAGATEWILSIARMPSNAEKTDEIPIGNESGVKVTLKSTVYRMRLLSENLAVLDYLHESLTRYSKDGKFEWPIWCGQLTIESFHSGFRVRNNARVIITSPMQRPSFIPGGSSLMKNHVPCSGFRCEPYNMIPVPPWGHIRGLKEQDTAVLCPVVMHLEETNQVAVPSGFHSYNSLDVRIVTKRRAQQSWPRIQRLETSWLVEKDLESSPLLCCWHDDTSDLANDRDYITYMIDFLKARDRLYRSQEPSERKY